MGNRAAVSLLTALACWNAAPHAGAPQDPANLWPQPRVGERNADRNDALEAKLCRLACDGKVALAEAQRENATDWIAAYRKYIGASPREGAMRTIPSGH
jgi:hypothetical protein